MNKIEELQQLIPTLRRFAFSLTGTMADADDLVQATIERLLEKGTPDDVHLTKWMFRVCRNVWIDEYRARKVRQDATQKPELQQNQVIDGASDMHNQVNLAQVNKAMDKLPEDQRSVLAMVAIEGMSYKEVANILEIPIGTVMSRLSRARTSLSQWLKIDKELSA